MEFKGKTALGKELRANSEAFLTSMHKWKILLGGI